MMKRLAVVGVLAALVGVSCSKQNHDQNLSATPTEVAALNKVENEIIVSNWEPIKSWRTAASGDEFSFTKSINKISEEEAVLVFVRNLWIDDPTYKELGEPDEPLMMPFHFLPFNKKPFYTEQWNYKTSDDQLNIDLKILGNGEVASVNQNLEFRYIIIPKHLLVQTGHTEQSLHELSYNEVVQQFKLSS